MIVRKTYYQEVYVMIKVNILNLSGFLETINQCKGRVSMLAPDGAKVNITRQYPSSRNWRSNIIKTGNACPSP